VGLDLELIKVLLAVAAGGLALYTFWRNQKVRRAEWLASLYEKFYGNEEFRRIRAALDYSGAEGEKLRRCLVSEPENAAVLEPLVNYLNFFEFVASLWKLGQLRQKEVEMMFEYYVRNLADEPEVMRFVEKEGFENLRALIRRIASD
jgi:hypothetical protein